MTEQAQQQIPEGQMRQGTDHGKRFFSWTFPEFMQYKRGMWWYIISSVIVTGLLVYAIYSANYLFAVIIALITFIFLIQMQRKPILISFSITEDGLEVHETFYPYKDIKSFWVIYEPPRVKKLYFEFKSGLKPLLSIPLESQNPLTIRETLLHYLTEDLEKEEELFSDALQRRLKI